MSPSFEVGFTEPVFSELEVYAGARFGGGEQEVIE